MLLNFFDAATTFDGSFGLTTRLDSLLALLRFASCVTWMFGMSAPDPLRRTGRQPSPPFEPR